MRGSSPERPEIVSAMIQLAYLSSSKGLLSPDDIAEILLTSRERNSQRGVTGMLLYKGGNILQILEGEPDVLFALFTKIEKDARHSGVIRLYEKKIEARDFPEWTMAFYDLNAEGARYLDGFSEILDSDYDIRTIKPSQAARLIASFKSQLR